MPGIAQDGSEDLPNDDIKQCGACANGCMASCHLEKDSPPSSFTPPAIAESVVFSDKTSSLTEFSITVEKMLCGLLQREWSATGMSITTLIEELRLKLDVMSGGEFLGLPVIEAAERLAGAISQMGKNSGMIREDAYLSGPHLLMICGDVTEHLKRNENLIADLRIDLESSKAGLATDGESYRKIMDHLAAYPRHGCVDGVEAVVKLIAENIHYRETLGTSIMATVSAEKKLAKALGLEWSPSMTIDFLCDAVNELRKLSQ